MVFELEYQGSVIMSPLGFVLYIMGPHLPILLIHHVMRLIAIFDLFQMVVAKILVYNNHNWPITIRICEDGGKLVDYIPIHLHRECYIGFPQWRHEKTRLPCGENSTVA